MSMSPSRPWSVSARAACAIVLALLLGLRLLGATGYMPAFERGGLTIIVCPDADANAPLALGDAHHRHGKTNHGHTVCPYASVAGLGALGADLGPLFGIIILATAAALLNCAFASVELRRRHERPPLRGPPIPA